MALREAALASLRLLGDAAEATWVCRRGGRCWSPRRRATARPTSTTPWCALAGPVAPGDVIAAYVDNADAEPAVRAAVEVVDDADLGDEDAEFTVGDAQDHDLAWYATQDCRSCSICSDALDTAP